MNRFTMRYGANGLPKKKREEEPSLMNLPPSLMQHDRNTPAAAVASRTPADFYAEEASMYTITEDSREARSEVTSLAGTSLAGTERGDALSVNTPLSPISSDPLSISPQGQRPVLTNWNHPSSSSSQSQWVQETFDEYEVVDEEEEQDRYRKAMVLAYTPQRQASRMSTASSSHHQQHHMIPALDEEMESNPSNGSQSEDDESFLFEKHGDRSLPMPMEGDGFMHERKRRRFSSAFTVTSVLVCVILAGVLIAICVPLTQKDDGSRSQVTGLAASDEDISPPNVGGGSDQDSDPSPTTVSTTESPTFSPTSAPTASPSSSPSSSLSSKPSATPSQVPTAVPSVSPSAAPTVSSSPTPQPTVPDLIASSGNPNLVQTFESLATCPYNDMSEAVDFTKPQYAAMWNLALTLQYSSVAISADEMLERWALLLLYTENGGNDWTTDNDWFAVNNGAETSKCTWSGITCNVNDEVTHIDLSSQGVEGVVPAELCCISTLESVDLSGNSMTGDIPPCLADKITVR